MTYRIPAVILAPLLTIVAAIYPAIWVPAMPVRKVASTLMVAGLVCLILAAVAIFHRSVVEITDKVIDRQVRQLRTEAIAELDANADNQVDAAWDQIVRGLTAPERPEEPR